MILTDLSKFYNIKNDSDIWQNCLTFIRDNCRTDQLYKNYLNLDPEKFFFFNGVIHNNEIISFGGIEYSPTKWGENIARVLTRFWIHPSYRSQGLTKWQGNHTRLSPLVLAPQIEFLKTHSQIKLAMISREGRYKNSFSYFLELANSVKDCNFKLIDGVYNVCEPMDIVPLSCKQLIAISCLAPFDYKLYLRKLQQTGLLRLQ